MLEAGGVSSDALVVVAAAAVGAGAAEDDVVVTVVVVVDVVVTTAAAAATTPAPPGTIRGDVNVAVASEAASGSSLTLAVRVAFTLDEAEGDEPVKQWQLDTSVENDEHECDDQGWENGEYGDDTASGDSV